MFDFGLYTQVGDSGPPGPLVLLCRPFVPSFFRSCVTQFVNFKSKFCIKPFYAPMTIVRGALCFDPVCLFVCPSIMPLKKRKVCVINSFQSFRAISETLHIYYKHIEDVHVNFCRPENNFWQNCGIFDSDNFEVRLQYGVASLWNQLLPEFSSNRFETLRRCYKHIEDVHVTFCRRKNNFWKNYDIST